MKHISKALLAIAAVLPAAWPLLAGDGEAGQETEKKAEASPAPAADEPKTGTVKVLVLPGGAKMSMIYCRPGEFVMGSPRDEIGRDGDEVPGFIGNICGNTTIGFKYFDMQGVKGVAITARAYMTGHFEVKTSWDGEVLATIPVHNSNIWERYEAEVSIPDGVRALYLTFRGFSSNGQLGSIELL